ncbi:MAG: SPOR domain-containing protein [Bdellovibrionaceae bacterium]|nr:SPOR domain-containing protein [Pseudobdellovibrionaceae bacterium]
MSNKSDSLVKLLVVFLLVMTSFAIGTYVGKRYSDNQHKLAALEPGSKHHSSSSSEEKSSSELTEEEIARAAEEFLDGEGEIVDVSHDEESSATNNSEKSSRDVASVSSPTKPGSDSHQLTEKKHEVSPAAERVARGEPPLKKDPPKQKPQDDSKRIPTALPENQAFDAVGKYTVQVAAFSAEAEAKDRANQLREQGFSAYYVPAQINGQTWYRVNVGLFASEAEAKEYQAKFHSRAQMKGTIIKKITN